ncbi:MAG: nuclear transport factor 2 family protein [Pseudomonadota bacterium]
MTTSIPQALQTALQQYFDVIYHCDLDKFDGLFAPSAQLQTMRGSEHVVISRDDYRAMLAQRVPPASVKAPRHDEVFQAELNGEACALAKVGVSIIDKQFVDYLCLLKTGGRWQIVSKVYTQTA